MPNLGPGIVSVAALTLLLAGAASPAPAEDDPCVYTQRIAAQADAPLFGGEQAPALMDDLRSRPIYID
jgi:hypothetical protein